MNKKEHRYHRVPQLIDNIIYYSDARDYVVGGGDLSLEV